MFLLTKPCWLKAFSLFTELTRKWPKLCTSNIFVRVSFESLIYIWSTYFVGGILLDRLILKTILQKNTILKLMRYLASSLPMTSSIKKAFRGSIAWHSSVEEFEPLELVSCRDELHKIFKFSYLWRERAHRVFLKN